MTAPHCTASDRLTFIPDDSASIAELCRPLSAKVMPRSAMIGSHGYEADASRVRAAQRKSGARQNANAPTSNKKGGQNA